MLALPGAYIEIQNAGTPVYRHSIVDFTGSITCSGNAAAGKTTCNVTGGGGGNSFSTIGLGTADSSTDTLTITDSATIDFTTTNDPEDLTAALIESGAEAVLDLLDLQDGGSLTCSPSQQVRRNSGDTSFECFTPSATAPTNAQYLTLAFDATLTDERLFNPTAGLDCQDAGAGLSYTCTTDSLDSNFLKSGVLVCGAGNQGRMLVHTTPLQYCDNAATPTLQYAAYGNSTGECTAAANNSVTLATDTTGSYVEQVADGTGIDGTANAEQATYTPTLDLTEISTATFGTGAFTTLIFDAGATDPTFTMDSNSVTVTNAATFNFVDASIPAADIAGPMSDGQVSGINEADEVVGTETDEALCSWEATGTLIECDLTVNAGTSLTADLEEEGVTCTDCVGIDEFTPNPGADDQVLVSDSTAAATWRAVPDCNTNNHLSYTASTNSFSCEVDDGGGGGGLSYAQVAAAVLAGF